MSPLPIAYLLEVLPYTLRAKGLTVFNLAQYCSTTFNGFVNPVGLEAIRWKYYLVFVGALVLWLVIIYFTFPETRGLSLEEVGTIFDGVQVLQKTGDVKAEIGLEEVHAENAVVDGKIKDVRGQVLGQIDVTPLLRFSHPCLENQKLAWAYKVLDPSMMDDGSVSTAPCNYLRVIAKG